MSTHASSETTVTVRFPQTRGSGTCSTKDNSLYYRVTQADRERGYILLNSRHLNEMQIRHEIKLWLADA